MHDRTATLTQLTGSGGGHHKRQHVQSMFEFIAGSMLAAGKHSRVAEGTGAVGPTAPLRRDVRFAVVARHAPRPPLTCRHEGHAASEPTRRMRGPDHLLQCAIVQICTDLQRVSSLSKQTDAAVGHVCTSERDVSTPQHLSWRAWAWAWRQGRRRCQSRRCAGRLCRRRRRCPKAPRCAGCRCCAGWPSGLCAWPRRQRPPTTVRRSGISHSPAGVCHSVAVHGVINTG